MSEIHVLFDGPPGNESGRFIEVENEKGESISAGRWEEKGKYWHLVIPRDFAEGDVDRLRHQADLARIILGRLAATTLFGNAKADAEKMVEKITEAIDHVMSSFQRNKGRPEIVVLCGSTRRAKDEFSEWYGKLTDEGKIVLSVGRLQPVHGWDEETKKRLDELHLRKIDLADSVMILNVGGYIGDSTARELKYAARAGKPIRLLVDDPQIEDAIKVFREQGSIERS